MIQSRNNCIFGRFAVSSGHTKEVRVLRRHDEIEGLHQAAVGQGARNNGASAQRHPIAGNRRIDGKIQQIERRAMPIRNIRNPGKV